MKEIRETGGATAPRARDRVRALAAEPFGRIVWLTGGVGSGRTTALSAAVEASRRAGIEARLVLAGDPTMPGAADLVEDLVAASRAGPVMFAADDVDRGDRAILERIVVAADVIRAHPILVLVVTAEPNDGHSAPIDPVLRRLAAAAERIHLEPLDAFEIAALLSNDAVSHGAPSTDQVQSLLHESGGIPQLVAAALGDHGLRGRPRGDARSRLAGSSDALLAALDTDALDAVLCASLMEEPVDATVLARACEPEGDAAVRRALASGLLVTDRSPTDAREDAPSGPVRLRLAAAAVRDAARTHDDVGRAARSLRIAEALHSTGDVSEPCEVLRHLRVAGTLAPRGMIAEVAQAALAEARLRGDLTGQVDALEALRSVSREDPDSWRALGSALATAALLIGRRDRAWAVARSVLRSFDDVPESELDEERRRVLVDALLAATTGQEYLSHEESDEAYELLMRTVTRLGEDAHAARLLCRAAEILSMRPHASAFVRLWSAPDVPANLPGDAIQRADAEAGALLERAEQLIGALDAEDPGMTAVLDVAWTRAHLHHGHAQERRERLSRSLHRLEGFDRAWAGTRLALDALAVGDRATVRQALIDASPTMIEQSPLVAWRVSTVRAMLMLASATPGARAAVEHAATLGERAAEPMAGVVALVQRGVARVESDLSPLRPEELRLSQQDAHPLILIGRLEIRARMGALRWRISGDGGARLSSEAAALLGMIRAGRMNRGNQQLGIVLLARVLFLLRHEAPDAVLVAEVADLLEPLGDLVPTDTLGLVCAGSAARHLANLRALQGRHDEAEQLADRARVRDESLGLDRFVLMGRIEAVERQQLAGVELDEDGRALLLADAVEAERRELLLLGREGRLAAHPELHGSLDGLQLDILEDLAEGLAFPDIAQRRGYSAGTMRKMALPVYRALGVHGRDAAVALGRRSGLLPDRSENSG